ncbi:hypothetical protein ACI79C_22460 [Geodermatophilus sp. SYSU D00697]
MVTTAVPVSEIDQQIAEAHRDLGVARSAFAESPSIAAFTACQVAEARLNEWLEARWARTRPAA